MFWRNASSPASSDAWECVVAWWLSLADAVFNLKMEKGEKRGKRKASLLETTKSAKKRVIPSCRCGEKVLLVRVLLELVVSAEGVFCGGREF